ncbi:MAG: prolipoprotein diacylglyceryl transferase [Desulfatiglans sp.]|jgi:phosphatidylglycerol:prolipoprotein diacylglycerol transferase|nr:prolipoprotein diacylglyceryl transferase [Thermodesulfobacteriota bacterium]MEE4352748.1 prolipoprotein diacylglyceryl transferase [Desulfatiglans sp.]
MFPDLFSIGPFTIHTYGMFVALGFFAGLGATIKIGKSMGIGHQQVLDMGFLIILAAIIGSRMLYILMNISYYVQRPIEILWIWEGGLVFSGGIIAVALVVAWYGKRHDLSFLKLGDLLVPGAALGQGIGRIGCLMAGCCYGKPTHVKWGIIFTHPNSLAPNNICLHPTQLYSSISGFLIFLILLFVHSKKKFEGQVLMWFLICHSTARLAIERFRGDHRGMVLNSNMTMTQFVATLILVVSVIVLLVLKSRNRRKSQTG